MAQRLESSLSGLSPDVIGAAVSDSRSLLSFTVQCHIHIHIHSHLILVNLIAKERKA